jgi:proteasome activator subunit 4
VLAGSKHWGMGAQNKVWDWFEPYMDLVLRDNLKTDTLPIWTSFLEVSPRPEPSSLRAENRRCAVHVPEQGPAPRVAARELGGRRVQRGGLEQRVLVRRDQGEWRSTFCASGHSLVLQFLSAFRAFYEQMNWKSTAWMNDAVERAWPELTGEHDDVRLMKEVG